MPEYHLRLILEYFRARPAAERTAATLQAIATHVAITYALDTDTEQALYHQAQVRLGLLLR